MKIATFNVNGITSRLPRLLEWLDRSAARHRLPAGAEDLRRHLPAPGDARPRATARSGTARRASTAWPCWRDGGGLIERRRGLPGDPDDTHSRYLEAAAHGLVVASIYLPNGNPQPGPKFDYKLAWFERLIEHAAEPGRQCRAGASWPATTTSSPPTSMGDIYNAALVDARTRCCSRRAASAYRRLARPGLDRRRSTRCTEASRSTPSGTTSATASRATPACASTTCCSTRRRGAGCATAGVDRGGARPREAERPRADAGSCSTDAGAAPVRQALAVIAARGRRRSSPACSGHCNLALVGRRTRASGQRCGGRSSPSPRRRAWSRT